MSDRDFFIALVLAAVSAQAPNPVSYASEVLRAFKDADNKGNVPA